MQNTVEQWFKNIPILTKCYLLGIFFVTVLFKFQLFDPSVLLLDWTLVQKKLHIWRLVSNFFFLGNFSMSWVFQMYMFINFSAKLESDEGLLPPHASKGRYLYFLLFQMLAIDIVVLFVAWPTGHPFMAPALAFSVIYYWSKRNTEEVVSIWGFQVKGFQFPVALLVLDLIMGQSIIHDLIGLATSHLFYFLTEILPQEKNIQSFAKTPEFCTKLIEAFEGTAPLASGNRERSRPSQTRPTSQSGPFQGSGQRLGGGPTQNLSSPETRPFPDVRNRTSQGS
eukprot:GHVP01054238.1.p1 GENE.GHVP01054238.1~~GHVP01054238.1.p1  ORF type:complete len:289 (+),score=37.57 GHVP01054238.1:25-867(+)